MRYLKSYKLFVSLLAACIPGVLAGSAAAQNDPEPVNIAAGKPASFGSNPNYDLCTDAEDTLQLTDGRFAGRPVWVDKATVGWNNITPVVITIDLGSIQPISGASYSTAAGIAAMNPIVAIRFTIDLRVGSNITP